MLHSLVDIHWEFVAVGAPAFFSLGVLVGLGAGPPVRLRPVWAGATAAGAVAVLYSLTAPYASSRLVDSAYSAIGNGNIAAALSDGRSARWLNPLATARCSPSETPSRPGPADRAALRYYRDAVRLQPENSSTWYALGSFEFFTGRYRAALHDLDRAYGLDPYGPPAAPAACSTRRGRRSRVGELALGRRPLAGSCPERGAAGRLSRAGGLCPAALRTNEMHRE